MNKNKKTLIFFLSLLAVILISSGTKCLALSLSPSESFYVNDRANVISEKAENYITEKNKALFAATGAQIVICTVDSTDGEDISDFCYRTFNEWKIGSSERNNGVLLVLAIEDDDYHMLQGFGIEDYLTSGKMKLILDEYLEPYFASGDYSRGVTATLDALISFMEDLYSTDIYDSYEPGNPNFVQNGSCGAGGGSNGSHYEDAGSPPAVVMILIIIIVIILIAVPRRSGCGCLPILFLGGGRRPPRGRFGGPPFGGPFGGGRGGFGGFGGGGRSGFGGGGRGGFGGGGGSHGGGAGRR